jgi:putative transposase
VALHPREWELRSQQRFASKAAGRAQVAAWIDEYDRERKHSSFGMRSPIDYERALRSTESEAAA